MKALSSQGRWTRLAFILAVLAGLLLASGGGAARATGNGQFDAARNFPVGDMTHGMATGDVNNDGKLDLIVANGGPYVVGAINVMLGVGDGTFGAPASYATGTEPVAVAVGDFNQDGWLDVATANQSGNGVSVLLNDKGGAFTTHAEISTLKTGQTASYPQSLAVGDFNGDSLPDLVVGNTYSYHISVLLNDPAAHGTFQAPIDTNTSVPARSVAVGDFDGDTMLDVATAGYPAGPGTVEVLFGAGNGSFRAIKGTYNYPGTSANMWRPISIAASDIDGDGHTDLVTATQKYENGDWQGSVTVLRNDGFGAFALTHFAGSGQTADVATGDLNGDGKPDLVSANNANTSGGTTIRVFINTSTSAAVSFQPITDYGVFGGRASFWNPGILAIGRFNNDSALDVAVSKGGAYGVDVWLAKLVAPTVNAISPPSGRMAGGTSVTVTGSGFEPGITVKIGGVDCVNVTLDTVTPGSKLTCTTGATTVAGAADVVVTNYDNQSATATGAYTYVAPPTVTSFSPTSGPDAGNDTVTIFGRDFQAGATVTFGNDPATSVPATSVTWNSATQLTVVTPPHAPGAVDVVVINPDQQRVTAPGKYTYLAPAPIVTLVNPNRGRKSGGTPVTIDGANFQSGVTVTIGGVACANPALDATTPASKLTCTTGPAAVAGTANVVVTNPDGQSATATGAYTYVAPPTVRSIDPASGPTAGGQPVTITGADFQNGATVSIGGSDCAVPVQMFVSVPSSATTIACVTGAHGWGPAQVVVTNGDGQVSTDAVIYTYVAPAPAIGGVSPTSGPTAGGTSVTISGSNFMNGATVKFGDTAATGVTFDHSGQLRATTPGHTAGTVDVVVTNPDGQAVTKGGAYTYVAPPAPAPAPPPPPASAPAPAPAPAPASAAGPGSSYSGWQSGGGQLVGHAPTLVSFQGRLYAVAVGNGNQVYLSSAPDGTTFGAWQPVGGDASVAWQSAGGIATSAPAAAVHDGALHLFVRGADNALYTSQSVDGVTFLPWRSLGGVLTTAPAATSFNGKLLVYAGGLDRTVYLTSSVDGISFSGWRSLGGQLPRNSLDPVAVTANQGILLVYTRGTDNQLYVMTSGSGVYYSAWWSLGGVLSSGPAAATVGNTTAVYVRGADGRLYETRASDGVNYSNWRDLGGVLVTAPAATSFNGQVHVATQGADGRLYTQSTQP